MNIQNLTDDETQSDEWQKIKDWAGGANKQPKHPLTQELERVQRRKPQKMDEGGVAGDDLNKILGQVAPQGTGIVAPSPVQAPPRAVVPPPQPQIQPKAPPMAPSTPPAVPAQPTPNPAPTNASYDQEASGILGGITPDTINQLMKSINSSNAKGQIGAGIAGIGDAIAKGVGRTDQNRMAETEANLKNRQEQALKAPELMASLGKERFGLSQTLKTQDPNSPYSKIEQNANRPLLKDQGFSDAEISKIPADAIESLRTGALKADEIRSTYGLAKETIAERGAYNRGMQDIQRQGLGVRQQEENTRNKALKVEHPVASTINDLLSGNGGSSGPHGNTVTQNGHTYNWNPDTKQYE